LADIPLGKNEFLVYSEPGGPINMDVERIILNAFSRLCQEKDMREIHVKEICQEANIARVTFYKYYEDIHVFISTVEERLLHDSNEILKNLPYTDFDRLNSNTQLPMLVDNYTYVSENMDIFRALYGPHGDPEFIRRIYDDTLQSFIKGIKLRNTNTSNPLVLAAFCAGASRYADELWILGKIKATPQKFALMIQNVFAAILNMQGLA
jgi:AcrR family transcriptional regulator